MCRRFERSISLRFSALSRKNDRGITRSVNARSAGSNGWLPHASSARQKPGRRLEQNAPIADERRKSEKMSKKNPAMP
ncbi:hypothetical protein EAW52_02715 [Pseudomonas sp. LTJR-52]|nr:hypothetical protein EAW52_02715 [Pseudomonas sp. LTJR-52]